MSSSEESGSLQDLYLLFSLILKYILWIKGETVNNNTKGFRLTTSQSRYKDDLLNTR